MISTAAEQEFIDVTYLIHAATQDLAVERAKKIAVEQTVELDWDLVFDPNIRETIVGKIIAVEPRELGGFLATIRYDARVSGGEIPQFLNVVFGNSSFMGNVCLWDIHFQHALFPGPGFGMAGIRQACGEMKSPLLCTALKPMGTSVEDLANMAHDLAVGGIHLLKDDHGLADQEFQPFEQRVTAVQQALNKAAMRTGKTCLYFPNFAPKLEQLQRYLEICRQQKVAGLLVAPQLIGMDMVRYLRAQNEFKLMLHPSWTGGHFHPNCAMGVRPAALLGRLHRMVGGDCSIFPVTGGRFGFDEETVADIVKLLREPDGQRLPAFPVPAGGMTIGQIPDVCAKHGNDLVLLIGSGLYRLDRNLVHATQRFKEVVDSLG